MNRINLTRHELPINLAHQAFPVAIAIAGERRARVKRPNPPCVPRLAVVEGSRVVPVLGGVVATGRGEATGRVSVSQFPAQSLV